MALRGDLLRERILFAAKEVFFEQGFERASMDAVASRAKASKRTLYAHFESKERLFLDVVEFVRGLVLGGVGSPADYADDPAEALVLFCGRYLEILLYEGAIQICRLTMAETSRLPEGAARFYDLMFTEVGSRLSTYVFDHYRLTGSDADGLADHLLGHLLYPRFPRALFGLDRLAPRIDCVVPSPDFDIEPVRSAVAEILAPLQRRSKVQKRRRVE